MPFLRISHQYALDARTLQGVVELERLRGMRNLVEGAADVEHRSLYAIRIVNRAAGEIFPGRIAQAIAEERLTEGGNIARQMIADPVDRCGERHCGSEALVLRNQPTG